MSNWLQIMTARRRRKYVQAGMWLLAAVFGWIGALLYYLWNLGDQAWWVRALKMGAITGLIITGAIYGVRWIMNY